MQELSISHSTPRAIPPHISFWKEVFGMVFFSYFFSLGSALLCIIWYIINMPALLYIVFCTIFIWSSYTIFLLYKRKHDRKEIFMYGKIVYGMIEKHSNTFSFFKSQPDYKIIITTKENNTTLYHEIFLSHKKTLEYYPEHNQIIWLYYNNKYLFPMELYPIQNFHITSYTEPTKQ